MKIKLILLVLSAACFISSCGSNAPKKTAEDTDGNKTEAQATEQVAEKEVTPIPENLSEEPIVELQTSMGNIKVKLYKDTPIHRDNFIKLVSEGFYNGVLFHRVIKDFMIQAGDPESIGASADKQLGGGGPGYTLKAEILPKYYHKKGVLAAARTSDEVNPERESSGSQFYIVQGKPRSDEELDFFESQNGIKYTQDQRSVYKSTGGEPFLDGGYTIFGEVVDGLGVVDAIAQVATAGANRPTVDVKIIKAVIIE